MCTFARTHVCSQMHTHTCMHTTYMHAHTCIYHTCTNTHTHACTPHHTHLQIHTHTHTGPHTADVPQRPVTLTPPTHGSSCPCGDYHVITPTSSSVKSTEWQLVSHFIDRDADTPGSQLTHQSRSHGVIPLLSLHGLWA